MLFFKAIRLSALLTTLGLTSIFTALLDVAPKVALADFGPYLIRAKHSNQCLNILDGSFQNGALATQGEACNTPNFVWRLVNVDGGYHFVVKHSNQCLNVLNGSTSNGASVVQGTACNTPNFNWRLSYLGNGYYHIINQQTGQCLNVLNGSFANGARVVQGTACNTPNFEWFFGRSPIN